MIRIYFEEYRLKIVENIEEKLKKNDNNFKKSKD